MQETRVDLVEVDEVAAALDVYFPRLALGAARGAEVGFHLVARGTGLGLNLVDIDIRGRELAVRLEDMAQVMVTTASMFDGEMVDAGRGVDTTLPYATRGGLMSKYSSATVSSLSLDEQVMGDYLARRVGGSLSGPFSFTGASPKSPAHGAMWRSLASTVGSAVRSGLVDDALLGPAMIDTVAAAFVACFPSNWTDSDPAVRSRPTAAVRRARIFIEEHAHEPVTLDDVARAARLSRRGVQSGFQAQLGVSPMSYLRRVRLDQARQALLDSDPADGARVAEVARAAGFAHMGRFAAAYLAEFGELPSHTLRR